MSTATNICLTYEDYCLLTVLRIKYRLFCKNVISYIINFSERRDRETRENKRTAKIMGFTVIFSARFPVRIYVHVRNTYSRNAAL